MPFVKALLPFFLPVSALAFGGTTPNPTRRLQSCRSPLVCSANALTRNADTMIPGVYRPDAKSSYVLDTDWLFPGVRFRQRVAGALKFLFLGGLIEFIRVLRNAYGRSVPATIMDARAKEREEGLSKAEFFNKYGFVLLDHKSAMSAEDWVESDRDLKEVLKATAAGVDSAEYKKVIDDWRDADTPGKRIYAKEVEGLVKSVLPQARTVMAPAKGIRRYPTVFNINRAPAKALHNDYGLNFEEVVNKTTFIDFRPQKKLYEETGAKEYMLVNFWRPILPMLQPLRSNPLCFVDSSTLRPEDFVTVDNKLGGVTTSLKDSPRHKYYFYPDMTTDEVVMFKQFHQVRGEPVARMPTPHTAFADPAANKDTEGRTSFEYRVGILC